MRVALASYVGFGQHATCLSLPHPDADKGVGKWLVSVEGLSSVTCGVLAKCHSP